MKTQILVKIHKRLYYLQYLVEHCATKAGCSSVKTVNVKGLKLSLVTLFMQETKKFLESSQS